MTAPDLDSSGSECTSLYSGGSGGSAELAQQIGMLAISPLILLFVKVERALSQLHKGPESGESGSPLREGALSRAWRTVFCDATKADVVLPIYDIVLWAATAEAVARGVISVGRTGGWISLNAGQWYFWTLWGFGVQGCRHFIALVVSLSLIQRSSGRAAFRRAAILATIAVLITGAIAAVLVTVKGPSDRLRVAIYATNDGAYLVLYATVLVYMACMRLRRWTSLYFFIVMQVLTSVLYVWGSMSLLLPADSPLYASLCTWTAAEFISIFALPFVVLRVLRDDSTYWRSLGRSLGASGRASGPELFEGAIASVSRRNYSQLSEFLAMEIELLDFRRLGPPVALGQGASSSVYRAKYDGKPVAIKSIEFEELTLEVVRGYCKEAILSFHSGRHRNVVEFLGVCLRPPEMLLAYEYCRRGSLRAFLDSREIICTTTRVQLALDVSEGMEFLHSRKIIHRDLKSDNVLIQEDEDGALVAKVADLGLSRIVRSTDSGRGASAEPAPMGGADSKQAARELRGEKPSGGLTTMVGTLEYLPPEILSQLVLSENAAIGPGIGARSVRTEYTHAIDVYAFGVVLWEVMTRQRPYNYLRSAQNVQRFVLSGLRLDIDGDTCPERYKALMTACWAANPSQRPRFSAVSAELKDIWFHDCAAYDEAGLYTPGSSSAATVERGSSGLLSSGRIKMRPPSADRKTTLTGSISSAALQPSNVTGVSSSASFVGSLNASG